MNKEKAFTLIELLVVIAIIALLMSILMPALAKAKKQALTVADLAAKHQMAVCTSSYTNSNDGNFNTRVIGSSYYNLWMYVYKPYYKDPKMRFCPAATNPKRVTGPFGTWNYGLGSYSPYPDYPMRANGASGPIDEREYSVFDGGQYIDGYFTGSIGMNRYIEDMRGSYTTDPAFWRRSDIKGASEVPIFIDSMYCYFWTDTAADPPPYDGAISNEMMWQCINRHMGYVCGVFVDWSARKIGLKELWSLKYSRETDTCGAYTLCGGVEKSDWPRWMRGFREY